MARYGFTLYGLRQYGEVEATRVYYVSGLAGSYTNYDQIELTWGPVAGDPADGSITHWKLIRSVGGVPDHPNDGTILDGDEIANYRVQYIDSSVPTSGIDSEVFYSLWVFNGLDWVNCGSVGFVVVPDLNSNQLMLEMLPAAWSNQVGGLGDITGEQEGNSDLGTFIDALAFMYDKLSAEISLISNVFDHRRIPTSLLGQQIKNMGFGTEPTLGDMFHRSLYRVGHIVNQFKGTRKGVVSYIAGLTHWASTVNAGRNLLNNYDDSSFEQSVGWWTASTGTLSAESYTNPANAPTFYLEDELSPARRVGYGRIASGTGATTVRPTTNSLLHGVPTEPGSVYSFKGYFKTEASTTTATMKIDWFDYKGVFISTSAGTGTTINTTWGLVYVEATAPSGAIYAQPHMLFASTTNAVNMDMLEFYEVDTTDPAGRLTFEDAHKSRIRLIAERSNLIPNPAFDYGVGGWLGYNCSLAQNFTVAAVYGGVVAELKSTGSGSAMVSEWIPVNSESPYTFSGYLRGTTGQTATLRIEFSHPASATDQIAVQTSGGNTFYVGGQHIVEETVNLTSNTWVRAHVTAVSPEYSADAGGPLCKVSIKFNGSVSGDSNYVDCVLLEQTPTMRDFFQGNGGPAPTNAGQSDTIYANDCKWEVKTHYNFVQQPAFASGWTNVTAVSTGTDSVAALYGTFNGKVVGTGAITASTTVPVPTSVHLGGSDLVASVFLYSKTAGSFTIGFGGKTTTVQVGTGQINNWLRLHVKTVATAGTTNYTLSVASAQAGTFYLNAPQVELGTTPTSFVDFTSADTVVDTVGGVTYRAARDASQYGGRSYYWTRYEPRYVRLADNLSDHVMLGTDWVLVAGEDTPKPVESDTSLAKSASFENGITGWTTINSTLSREVALGSLFSSTALHGGSYGRVTKTASGTYGVKTDLIEVRPFAGHYVSVGIKPVDSASHGTYTLKIDWLDDAGNPLVISGVTQTTTVTSSITQTSNWGFMMLTSDSKSAAYAQVTVSCATGNGFLIDHVLIRE